MLMHRRLRTAVIVNGVFTAINHKSDDSLALARRMARVHGFFLTAKVWRRVGWALGRLQDKGYIKFDDGAYRLTERGRGLLDVRKATVAKEMPCR